VTSASRLGVNLFLSLLFCASAFSQQSFQYTTLQVPGSSQTFATAVNNNGDIVGYSESDGIASGFLYTNGSFQTISPCPHGGVEPMGTNDQGVIVGTCNDGAFMYQNGNVTYLAYPKATATFLTGINNEGVIMGGWQRGSSTHSFAYSNGTFTAIGDNRLVGGINNSNTVSGTICNGKTDVCKGAVFFQDEDGWKTHKSVKYPGAAATVLGGINDNGDVVGFTGEPQDFVYNISSKTFTGFQVGSSVQSEAQGINNSGEIVGWYTNDGATFFGFYGQLSQ
jgi:probable HAF family extracellular repeat protein